MQKSDIIPSQIHPNGMWIRQLTGMGYAGLYAQFAHFFDVKRGDINDPAANMAGAHLAKNLIFGKDGEAQELYDALNTWLTNPTMENLVEVADGAADLIYVILQLCHALDIPIDNVFQAVHNNNMTKVHMDGTVKRREDGKVLKPDGYKPVELWPVLFQHSEIRARETGAQGAENWKQGPADTEAFRGSD
jgi:phosphoribosyl-ATP pyrophosphohydrolase